MKKSTKVLLVTLAVAGAAAHAGARVESLLKEYYSAERKVVIFEGVSDYGVMYPYEDSVWGEAKHTDADGD